MTRHDKLLKRLLSKPKDFSFDELVKLLGGFGYEMVNKGKTSGSRVAFEKSKDSFQMHKPHNRETVLLHYQIKELVEFLVKRQLIKEN